MRVKNSTIFAIGLLLVSASSLLPLTTKLMHFINGFCKGLGIVMMLASVYKMRKQRTAKTA